MIYQDSNERKKAWLAFLKYTKESNIQPFNYTTIENIYKTI